MMKAIPAALFLAGLAACSGSGSSSNLTQTPVSAQDALATATPIKHVVVIFGENISFDHYFGTYPNATNPTGEPAFTAASGTPTVAGLTPALLTANPNSTNTANGTGAANPFRLDRSQALTADQNHGYTAEQNAYNGGAMDLFPKNTGTASSGTGTGPFYTKGLVMGYYDGNTVTALWNYAQHFAMSDNSFDTQFGPSTPGALNLISGQTNGVTQVVGTNSTALIADGQGGKTMISDIDPSADTCSSTTSTSTMSGKNIGDLLNAKNVSWGWFEGGFDLTATNANGTTGCARSSFSTVLNGYTADYIPHHQPFQYYASTANPKHVRPSSVAVIGTSNDGGANHQYDTNDFFTAVAAGNFPSVSFLKAQGYQDGHAGYSNPLDEQAFITKVVNFLQQQPDWANTVVIMAYDDSDGWYDHVSKIVNGSTSTADTLNGASTCGSGTPLNGINGTPVQGRCGYGPRLPLVVVSPYAKANFVDHTVTDQSSVLRFVEDNWLGGARIGQGSFDAIAGSIQNMFDFTNGGSTPKLNLNTSTGLPM
ncbi:Acid phosphatase [Collimonas arenae]|uniref:Acid phosphatase n=2 Tax=Collimonas arenae TaxID=279058 RepID=A0A0A1FB94_9BURK|nr:Acid phosphatase [Collimonas arenae]